MNGCFKLDMIAFSFSMCFSSPFSFKDCFEIHFSAKKLSSLFIPLIGCFNFASFTRPNAPIPSTFNCSKSDNSTLGENHEENIKSHRKRSATIASTKRITHLNDSFEPFFEASSTSAFFLAFSVASSFIRD